ncbi:MAG: hypothetical protein RJA36_680 [Pseudomonadota bacterium]|jgi:copper(I)-binding protein
MKRTLIAAALLGASLSAPALAHVVLAEPSAVAGSHYKAVLRVGHGCDGSPTTGLRVSVPAGFEGARPQPKPGWNVTTRKARLAQPYSSHGKTVSEDVVEIQWSAASRESALPDGQFDEFAFTTRLPDRAGPAWVKVLQTCEKGQIDWSELPAAGSSTKGLKSPAALLEIKPAAPTAAVAVSKAWARATVPGQKATGAFMTLQSADGARLIGVKSPLADVAEIHEMKMDGNVMKMSPVAALELPAGKAVELKPGGYHVMLMDLKGPLNQGASLPLTLNLQDARGQKFQLEVSVPVALQAPGEQAAPAQHQH